MRGVEKGGETGAWDLQGVRKKRSGHQGRLRGARENQEMRCKYLIGNFIYSVYHTSGIKKRQGFVIRRTQVSHRSGTISATLQLVYFLLPFPQVQNGIFTVPALEDCWGK